jgi:predicted nucleotidyltransferase
MNDESTDQEEALVKFAAAMDAIGVEYMVTGSTALNFYAQPRLTRDIDVVIEPRRGERNLIATVFAEDFGADPELVERAIERREIFNVYSDRSIKIDVIVRDRILHPDDTLARGRPQRNEGYRSCG